MVAQQVVVQHQPRGGHGGGQVAGRDRVRRGDVERVHDLGRRVRVVARHRGQHREPFAGDPVRLPQPAGRHGHGADRVQAAADQYRVAGGAGGGGSGLGQRRIGRDLVPVRVPRGGGGQVRGHLRIRRVAGRGRLGQQCGEPLVRHLGREAGREPVGGHHGVRHRHRPCVAVARRPGPLGRGHQQLERLPRGGDGVRAVRRELVQRERSYRLQQPPPAGRPQVHDQALVDEPAQHVGHRATAAVRGHRDGGVQVEATDERGQPAEQRPLLLVQQVVAPADHRAQRAVALVRPAAAGQQPQVVVQGSEQATRAERGAARGGEFDRQRHPVQAGAQLGHHGRFGAELGVRRGGFVGPSSGLERLPAVPFGAVPYRVATGS